MPRLLLALPLALLTLFAQAEDAHHHEPGQEAALAAHEHGSARLNLALDGDVLEIEFASPAMNLLGFEHAPRSDADRAMLAAARARLEQPLGLFGVPAAAGCQVREHSLHGALFEPAEAGTSEHSEIEARYRLQCSTPDALQGLNLAALFGTFPATQKLQVQLIGPRGQQGLELSPERSGLTF
ncbi:DUF2796 domain-containing protein [Azotobacter chroococcum]|uniref:DUF2796 domain-containing protein n=1 Tax=Azotobacter chroococcum TaxID=353 RepID=A0AA43Z4W0_9GAMM|nr:DUF2796 domain-containing protein [Azotobacter chroococcum]NHN75737.1 DUF2796 domain-containing protein [Azotobacter chroococcum]